MLFSGCVEPTPRDANSYDSRGIELTDMQIRGHDYIKWGWGHGTNVFHDPECKKCKQNLTKEKL